MDPTFGALLLQAGFLSHTSWISIGLLLSIVTGTVVITTFLVKIRAELSAVTSEAGRANDAIGKVSVSQAALAQQLATLADKVGMLVNNHVSRNEFRLWILRFKVANPGLNVPDFAEEDDSVHRG